jgi:hypothetical protein
VTGNKHSALLQEVKRVLKSTFPNTEMRGDGQVVVVGFARINVEVVPAFTFPNGQYLICDTHNGGSYKFADPKAEMRFIAELHEQYVGNLRPLIMMMKAWQETCDVPIKSFWLELVAADFLRQYRYADKNYFWYDWMMRDFFAYLYNRAGSWVFVPGTGEAIFLGDKWRSRALTAYNHAVEACDNEYHDYVYLAGQEWQKIFGSQIPKS